MKKFILACSVMILLAGASCSKKELSFEEKLKLPGSTSDTSCAFIDDSIKTFDDYEQKYILVHPGDFAIVKVKCDKVNHYLYVRDGLISPKTDNLVTITEVLKTYGQDVYTLNQQIELLQHYGYCPYDQNRSLESFFEKEYGQTQEQACERKEGKYPVKMNGKYQYTLMVQFEDTIPLDENEEYLMVLNSDISKEDNTREYWIKLMVPYNTAKYRDLLDNKYDGFRFSEYWTNLRNELRKEFIK